MKPPPISPNDYIRECVAAAEPPTPEFARHIADLFRPAARRLELATDQKRRKAS